MAWTKIDTLRGTPGTPGLGLTTRGAWSSATSYAINDVVSYTDGTSYYAIATSLNVVPGTDASKWGVLAAKGATGGQGIQGNTGNTGLTGTRGSKFLGKFANQAALPAINGTTVMVGDYAYLLDVGELWDVE